MKFAHRYLAFHKPYDVLSQFTDEGTGHRTLREFIDVPGVYPVGRLDRDSEGLLLLTSDGELQHRISDPKFGHERAYWAQVEGAPTEATIAPLREGVMIQGSRTKPAKVRIIDAVPTIAPRNPPIRYRAQIPTAWIELALTEGRNRQVRRMTAAVGLPTLRLIRVEIGSLRLDDLAPGKWRDLTERELSGLRRR